LHDGVLLGEKEGVAPPTREILHRLMDLASIGLKGQGQRPVGGFDLGPQRSRRVRSFATPAPGAQTPESHTHARDRPAPTIPSGHDAPFNVKASGPTSVLLPEKMEVLYSFLGRKQNLIENWQSFRRGGSRTTPTKMKLSHYQRKRLFWSPPSSLPRHAAGKGAV